MKKVFTEPEALNAAAALCSTSEHCVRQIEEKLSQWGVEPDASERIISRLIEEKYIDESRFARAYALDKFRYNRWGRVKIDFHLRSLAIAPTLRHEALAQIDDDEYQGMLSQLLQSKEPGVKASSDYERRGKLIRFALGRGFEMDAILRCLPEQE